MVTGASKGIGLAVTRALVDEGVTVVAGARSAGPDLPALVADGRVVFVPVDLSGPAGPVALVEAARQLGGVDILVNNAGAVTPRPEGFRSVTDEDWEASIALTLMAAVTHHPGGAARDDPPRWRQHHHHQLGERLPPRPAGDRLLGRQGRADELLQVLVEGGRAGRASGSTRSAPDRWRPVSGWATTGWPRPSPTPRGVDPADVAAQAAAGAVTGRFTRPARSPT